jgi:CRP-like cAMP-binding protein
MAIDGSELLRNRVLAGLPDAERRAVAGRGVVEDFPVGVVVFREQEPIERVLFPLAGVFSLLSTEPQDQVVEVATVGREGFVGLPVFLQARLTSAHRAVVQVPGRALAMSAPAFMELGSSGGALQTALQRYTQALITQIAQNAACNRAHSVEQRCARWLLMTHDRVDGDRFDLTQEFLAQMLGVGRAAVNGAAQTLQDAGCITYSRGRLTIVDRARLEAASCECYAVIRQEFDRLTVRPGGAR